MEEESLRNRFPESNRSSFFVRTVDRETVRRNASRKQNAHMFTESVYIYIALFYLGIFAVVYYCDVIRLPKPVSSTAAEKRRSHTFSEENARKYLQALSSIGIKPTGSYENEKLAVDYILRELNNIKLGMDDLNTLQLDVQRVTGCFPLRFKDGMTSCYENVTNVIAKLGPPGDSNSLLVNCHFDSFPTSPGASDDVASCAIMLDVLHALSKSNEKLKHSIVFLFNGAEENILQAAHGFIVYHKWAIRVLGFINLEACGSGGKQMLFQADKYYNWILQAYIKSADYPQGSVIAQDVFQSGLIPSDTDYRIFTEFGDVPGLDFAFVKNGYVYHTKYDQPQFINEGALQQAGQNLLNLIYECLKSPAMDDSTRGTRGQLIFYDFLGLFMVSYGCFLSYFQSLMILIFVFYDITGYLSYFKIYSVPLSNGFKEIGKAFGVLMFGLVVALVLNFMLAIFLSVVGYAMAWYRQPYLIAFTYGCSTIAVIFFVQSAYKKVHETGEEMFLAEHAYFEAAKLFWVIVEIMMFRVSSHFMCDMFLLFPTLVRALNRLAMHYFDAQETRYTFLYVHLLSQVLPLLMLFYCVWSLYNVFIPILGRVGASLNPELVVACITTIFVFISSIFTMSLVQCTSTMKKTITTLSVITAVTFALIMMTPFGFPYSGNEASPAPMRTFILHADRNFYNYEGEMVSRDSGYWVVPLDFNGPKMLRNYIKEMDDANRINCRDELGCGMPFYFAVVSILKKSYFVPGPATDIPQNAQSLKLVTDKDNRDSTKFMTFKVQGTDHMILILAPRLGFNLTKWTLYSGTPLAGLKWRDRDTYFIYYSYGNYSKPWEFSLLLNNEYGVDGPVLDVLFVTHYIHGKKMASGKFYQFLNQLPPWVHTTFWTSAVNMYTF